MSMMTMMGVLAMVTAARGASPSRPTIKESSIPREAVTMFWRTMGTASMTTSR